jgi:hypothetical protein
MAQQNMGGTFLSDLITRPEFLSYTSERIFEQSAFLQSGVITRNAALDARAGGTRVRVPFFDFINPTEEVITSGNSWGTSGAGYLTSQNVTADEQIMTILHRGFQFGTDDLSRMGSGADPLGHVANQLAASIAKKKTGTMLAQIGGLFGNISGSGVLGANTQNVTGTTSATAANYLTAANVVKAKSKLGERGSELTAIAMHSSVANYLEETGYMQVQVSGGSLSSASGLAGVSYNTFAGLRVIVDDQLGVITGGTSTHLNKYPVFLFGANVIAEGIQQDLRVETDRNKSSFQDLLIVDYHYGYHVAGTKWAAAGDNPTNAATTGNLGATASWSLAYNNIKNVPLVRLLVNTPYDVGVYA